MTIQFYFDEHMSRSVAEGLIERGYSVTMAVDVGMVGKDDDSEHLPFAKTNGMVIVTFDRPFAGRTMAITDHAGLICLSENLRSNIGAIIRLLVDFAERFTSDEVVGRVFWLK